MAAAFPKGSRVTRETPVTLADGSHATTWTHRIVPAGTILTVTGSTRWAVYVRDDRGGVGVIPRGGTVILTAYDAAIAYAAATGAEHGRNAAEWYVQDSIGGRSDARRDAIAARMILRGIADGDPAVLDTLPYADLSGEHADTLTGPQLYRDAYVAAGYSGAWADGDPSIGDDFTDICDAYDAAFATAAEDAIAAACRAVLED